MRRNWILVLLGFAIFVAAFFLPAIKEVSASANDKGIIGYKCALLALELPWGSDGAKILHDTPGMYFSILISGWINPAFLIVLVLVLIRPASRVFWALRVLVALMFVACWIVFGQIHFRAQIGYYLWMAGILLALFSPMGSSKQDGK